MSFKEYMKMLIVISPILILALIISFGISKLSFKLFIICVIVYPFILIKYFEWILNKFY